MKYPFFQIVIISLFLSSCSDFDKSDISQEQSPSVASKIKIRNLYDAFGKENNQSKFDFGFSALIEFNGKTILFDSGTDAEIFKNNVNALGIDLKKVDIAIQL